MADIDMDLAKEMYYSIAVELGGDEDFISQADPHSPNLAIRYATANDLPWPPTPVEPTFFGWNIDIYHSSPDTDVE